MPYRIGTYIGTLTYKDKTFSSHYATTISAHIDSRCKNTKIFLILFFYALSFNLFYFLFPNVGIFSPQLGKICSQVREQKKRAPTLNVSTRKQHLLCQLIGILLFPVFLYRLKGYQPIALPFLVCGAE